MRCLQKTTLMTVIQDNKFNLSFVCFFAIRCGKISLEAHHVNNRASVTLLFINMGGMA